MLSNNRISAVLVSTDLERSQRFYEAKVGLTLAPGTIKNHLVFDCGGGTDSSTPPVTPATPAALAARRAGVRK